jgi:hypothetical protein
MRDLAAALTRDALAHRSALAVTVLPCFACGHSFTYHGPSGDDSGRFCFAQCREWHDAGNPPAAENPGFHPRGEELWREKGLPELYGLRGWKSDGREYYADIIAASDRKRAELAGRELIRPRKLCAKCGGRIPVWINGRKVRADRIHCDACQSNITGKRPKGRLAVITQKIPA